MENIVYYYPSGHESHFEYGHPERPERIEAIRQGLMDAGWWDEYPHLDPLVIPQKILTAIHTPNYLKRLEATSNQGAHLDMDTYTTPASWEISRKTAGGALAVAEAVWRQLSRRGLALTRPPGHHATSSQGMGFCLLNNVALAAEHLLHGDLQNIQNAKQLAIIDIDLHHGNGTQDIFWERKDVLYISTHQSPLYPGTGQYTETGSGDGAGFTLNIPLPPGTGDQGFNTVMTDIILPILDRTKPEMLLVSVGFDPHWRDPLGHLMLTANGYTGLIRHMVEWVDRNAGGRIALFLEGGYDLQAGQACLQGTVSALLGEPWTDWLGEGPRPEGKSWQPVLREVKKIWEI